MSTASHGVPSAAIDPHHAKASPMTLHTAPDPSPRTEPATPEPPVWLDPVIHALCVVEIAAMNVTYQPGDIPEPVSSNCGYRWQRELGRFDVDLVCTLPARHRGDTHDALDGDGVSHGTVMDERMAA